MPSCLSWLTYPKTVEITCGKWNAFKVLDRSQTIYLSWFVFAKIQSIQLLPPMLGLFVRLEWEYFRILQKKHPGSLYFKDIYVNAHWMRNHAFLYCTHTRIFTYWSLFIYVHNTIIFTPWFLLSRLVCSDMYVREPSWKHYSRLFFPLEEAGWYHTSNLITAVKDVWEHVWIAVQHYNFSTRWA